MATDPSTLSSADIRAEIGRLTEELKRREAQEKRDFFAEIAARAAELNISSDEVLRALKGSGGRRKPAGVPMYRNPDNAAETWTGRGRKPGWLISQLEAGTPLQDMAI